MVPQKNESRVFVVDDELVIASTLAIILQTSGFRATSFIHPLEALEAARLTSPDLLITDVVMPELSGIDLAIRIRELNPACKVLLFSGQAATVDLLEQARVKGHNFQVLSKPIHPSEFLRKVRDVEGAVI